MFTGLDPLSRHHLLRNICPFLVSLAFGLMVLAEYCLAYSGPDSGRGNPFEEGYVDQPSETGLLGSGYLDYFDKYHQITSGGDININIPLFTIPGKIPVDLTLNYQSGIKVDQPATWVGLGWSLAQWSVRRITVHGDDQNSWVQDVPNTREDINDMFLVSVPGRSLKFINTGTRLNPVLTPLSYSNDSLFSVGHLVESSIFWDYYEPDTFVMVDADGTRYVFAQALGRKTVQTPAAFMRAYITEGDRYWTDPVSNGNCEWLLTAILSHDYVDGANDTLNPLDCADPRVDNKGAWAAFVYTKFAPEGYNPYVDPSEYTKGVMLCGPLKWDQQHSSLMNKDTTEFAYLRKIVTPNTLVKFDLHTLCYYHTPRYLRSNFEDIIRIKDAMLGQIKVYEYSGNSTIPNGPELYCVTLEYTWDYSSSSNGHNEYDMYPLKKAYYRKFEDLEDGEIGEPRLRRLTIGTYTPYNISYPYSSAKQTHVGGFQKAYTFNYIDSFTLYEDQCFSKVFDESYQHWARGGPTRDLDTAETDVQDIVLGMYILNCDSLQAWGSRELFGYYYYHPEAWSICKLTTPEGLSFEYIYQSDQYKIDTNLWDGGGTRVKSVVINRHTDPIPFYPPYPGSCDDYNASDTINLTYGYNDDGIGYATTMPTNWHRYSKRYTEPVRFQHIFYSRFVERFQGDNVSHEIQYPLITWHLPDNRGTIENYYLATDSVPGHVKHSMHYTDIYYYYVNDIVKWILLDTFEVYHSFWQDRSPFLGLPYKRIIKNNAGENLFSEQKFFSWVPVVADIFIFDDTALSELYPCLSFSPFPVGDTVAASYFVRLDSTVHQKDGVRSASTYAYDNIHRIDKMIHRTNDHDRITEYEYASDFNTDMLNRHYLNARHSMRESRLDYATQTGYLENYEEYEYRSDFPSQNLSGQDKIWYRSRTKHWIDLDNDGSMDTLNDISAAYEFLVTGVIDVDKYGNNTIVENPGGISNAYVYSFKGFDAEFTNIGGDGYGFANWEADINNQPAEWSLGAHGVLDSTVAFTGRKSVKISADPSITTWGPVVSFSEVDSGMYITDLWVRCSEPSKFRLQIFADGVNNGRSPSIANEWQRLVCSVLVASPGDELGTYTAYDYGTAGEVAYVDDYRIYPAGATVNARTYDGMLRVTSESNSDNIPARHFYNQYDEVAVTADHNFSPVNGQERFYKSTEHAIDFDRYRYNRSMPNALYTFDCRRKGVVDDFTGNPFLKYSAAGNGALDWDTTEQRLQFIHDTSLTSDTTYGEIVIDLDTFSNGFITVDYALDISDYSKGASTEPDFEDAPIYLGFENDQSHGYAVGFDCYYGAEVVRYTGPNYTGRLSVGKAEAESFQAFQVHKPTRIMFGKIDSSLYVFYNNDCLHVFNDNQFNGFTRLKLRFRNAGHPPEAANTNMWIDNLVFFSDPVITADFINAYGMPKQRQIFDGKNIIVSGQKNTNDFRENVQFMPIAVQPDTSYPYPDTSHPYWESNMIPGVGHRSLFDFIRLYLVDTFLYAWEAGQELDTNSLIYTYCSDSVGTPDFYDKDSLLIPYSENIYFDDPLRRVKDVRFPGSYRDHSLSNDYGCSEVPLSGFDPTYYDSGTVYREPTIDENDVITATYKDKLGRPIGVVADSIAGGINAYTRFEYDYNGNPILIVQPEGHRIVKKYNNLNWLVYDSSGDYGVTRYEYDKLGNLRFTMTASDGEKAQFCYNKYDAHNRTIEEGTISDTSLMIWANAIDRDFPDASGQDSTYTIVTAKFEYDSGEFGRGLLTKSTRYASGDPDSASWQKFEYDEYARVTKTEQFVDVIDDSFPRVFGAAYNNLGDLTRLTYPNGKYVDYFYDRAGQVSYVIDNDSTLKAAYDYWPDGSVKQKVLGLPENGGPAQTVDYRYNARGWLESINDGAVNISMAGFGDHFSLELTYDSAGHAGAKFYNGNIASYTLKTSPGTGAAKTVQRFDYDGLDRLLAESFEGFEPPPAKVYQFDDNGNIELITQYGLADTTLFDYIYYDSTNRLEQITDLASGTNNLEYTPNGAMSAYNNLDMSMAYNDYDEMVTRSVPDDLGTDHVSYWYNNSGKRIAKQYHYYYERECGDPVEPDPGDDPVEPMGLLGMMTTMSGTGDGTIYCLDSSDLFNGYYYFSDRLLSEYTGPGESDLEGNFLYINGEREAFFKDEPGDVRYFLTDHLGSVVATVRYDGRLRNWSQYVPFGDFHRRTVTDPGATGTYNYTGQKLDEELGIDWYYYGARYYDPELRIFASVDPMAGKYPSHSPYLYCANNPMNYIDPDGEIFWFAAAVAFAGGMLLGWDYANAPTSKYDQTYHFTDEEMLARTIAGCAAGYAIGRSLELAADALFVDTPANVPNPYGRKGGESHQTGVDEAEDEAKSEFPGSTIKQDSKIDTPGGNKDTRYGDVVVYDEQGKPLKAYQVGDVLQDKKTPVKRERDALDDIKKQGVKTKFIPKKK